MMKAIKVDHTGGPKVLKVETNIPVPVPSDTQVLVEVKAAGINPIDTYIRSGNGVYAVTMPYTPGFDGAGIVKKVGAKVTKLKPGDRVFVALNASHGFYAEYAIAEESMTQILDDKLSFSQGAALGIPYYSAYKAMFIQARDKMKPGNKILIHGASGAVGIACVQIAVAHGLKVYGTAGSKKGLDLVLKQGATAVFNHHKKGYTDKIMEETNQEGPDVIIEMLANVNLQNDLEMIKQHGVIVVVGSRDDVKIAPWLFMTKQCIVTGILLLDTTPDEWLEMHAKITEGIQAGWLVPVVGHEYTLEQAPKAHEELINTKSATGKLVFVL